MKKFSQEKLMSLLEDLKPQLDRTGKNLIVDCPWCKHREAAVSINKDGNLFGCFRKKQCGEVGNIWRVLREIGKLGDFISNPDEFDISNINHLTLDLIISKKELILDVETCHPPLGWRQTFSDEYLDERNFTEYKQYPVGRTLMEPSVKKDYVIFLVLEDSELKAWVGRHVWPKSKIEQYNKDYELKHGIKNKIRRYRNTPGVDFAKLLYGIDEITIHTHTVILVEGIFDKIAIDRKMQLKNDESIKCVATFKGHVSDEQIAKLKLKGINHIILLYDPDVIDKIKESSSRLEDLFDIQIALSNNGKDPDEMTTDEFFECMSKLHRPSKFFTDFMQLKPLKF